MRFVPLAVSLVLLVTVVPAYAQPGGHAAADQERVQQRGYDEHGRLILERGIVADSDGLGFERRYWLAPHEDAAKGGNGGGGGKPGGGGSDPGTDCASDKYALTGHRWTQPYSAKASSFASLFDQAGRTWDDATGAAIFAGVTAGSAGVAGVQDFQNQIDFVSLGATSTIAVTTTWYYIASGEAVESDGQYNTYYAWTTDGSAGTMDVLHIATHEIGHTFGLDHPKGNPSSIGCLTMYAYADFGWTHGRTLGDGDIIGIQALYGA